MCETQVLAYSQESASRQHSLMLVTLNEAIGTALYTSTVWLHPRMCHSRQQSQHQLQIAAAKTAKPSVKFKVEACARLRHELVRRS